MKPRQLKDTLDFYTSFGTAYVCNVRIGSYVRGGTPTIELYDAASGEPVAVASMSVPGLGKNEVAVKNYSENEGMLKCLLIAGIVSEPHRHVQSGYVVVPVCKLLV